MAAGQTADFLKGRQGMKLIFSKDDLELVKICVQNELSRLENAMWPQIAEFLKVVDKRIAGCQQLLERIEYMEDKK